MTLRVRVRMVGTKRLQRSLDRGARRLPSEAEKNVRLASELVIGYAQRKRFKGSRTRARRKGRPVTAPPGILGIDTGRYRQSIIGKVTRRGKRIQAIVGPAFIKYAAIHEFGGTTPTGGRIPPRPVLTPAVDATRDKVFRLIGSSFRVIR